jgi:hypothetical protein
MYDNLNWERRVLTPAMIGLSVLAAGTCLGGRRAEAQLAKRTALGLDLGVGSVLSRYSPEAGDGGALLFLSLRGDYDLTQDLQLQLLLRQWSLPGSNHATMPGVGARFEPYQSELGRAFVDAAVGVAWTRDGSSFGFDLGGGFEVDLPTAPGLGLGPVLRYGQVVNPAARSDADGRAWSLGVSATFHLGRAEAGAATANHGRPAKPPSPYVFKVLDTDHDGVTDDVDQCPEVPAGRHPDAFRRGCPENDEDKDGVADGDDVCPMTPAGDHPDRARPGCPFTDSDGDGIADLDDRCPTKAGPATQDPTTNGCPPPRKAAVRPEKEPPAGLPAPNAAPKRNLTRVPR